MQDILEKIRYSELFEIYKNLLTDKQKEYFISHYDYDLSLTEIAKNNNVSKNAVHDNLKRVCKSLEDYEEALSLYKKEKELAKLLDDFDNLEKDEIRKILEQG